MIYLSGYYIPILNAFKPMISEAHQSQIMLQSNIVYIESFFWHFPLRYYN